MILPQIGQKALIAAGLPRCGFTAGECGERRARPQWPVAPGEFGKHKQRLPIVSGTA